MPTTVIKKRDDGMEAIPVPTDEEYQKFRKAVIKKLKFLEGLIDDTFDRITALDDRLTENVDEAIDHASRAQRAVTRMRKEYEDHDHDDED